jgi:hypothetical protein
MNVIPSIDASTTPALLVSNAKIVSVGTRRSTALASIAKWDFVVSIWHWPHQARAICSRRL